ncbi:MFS transporter [Levilactobacillus spicheri]|uniref:MFS transporter n=1 Tax=Levilactobacillus spicheri TaxID=216463 RepID=UPI001CDBF675|nr:MFS transporter [Levilactobacillus spicheri]
MKSSTVISSTKGAFITENNRFKLQSLLLTATAFILGFSEFNIIGVLNDIAHQFHVSVSSVGYLVTIFALVYAISTPIFTTLIEQHRLLPVLLSLMGIFTLGNLITVCAPTYAVLTLSRIMIALVSGVAISITMTFAIKLAPKDRRAWLIAWVYSGFSIAAVLGMPIGTWVSEHWGWRMSFLVITLLSVVLLIMLASFLPRQLRQSQEQKVSLGSQLIIFKDWRILLGVLVVIFNFTGIYVVYTYLRPIFVSGMGIATTLITPLFMAYGFMTLGSNQFSGRLAAHSGLTKMPRVYGVLAIALACLPLGLQLTWVGLLIVFIMGFSMYLINSPIQLHFLGITEKDYPQSMVLAASLHSIFCNVGIATGSAIGGLLVAHGGLNSIGPGGAIFILVTLGLVVSLNHLNQHWDQHPHTTLSADDHVRGETSHQ